jgi:hypothetical protein
VPWFDLWLRTSCALETGKPVAKYGFGFDADAALEQRVIQFISAKTRLPANAITSTSGLLHIRELMAMMLKNS